MRCRKRTLILNTLSYISYVDVKPTRRRCEKYEYVTSFIRKNIDGSSETGMTLKITLNYSNNLNARLSADKNRKHKKNDEKVLTDLSVQR